MFYLVYTSSATQFFSQDDLEALLNQARKKNSFLDITGLLLYHAGEFMQILEGEEAAVMSVYAKITQDLRHQNINLIVQDEEPARTFPDWSMAFRKLDGIENPAFGYSDFLNYPLNGHELEQYRTLPERLLIFFKKNQS